MHEMSDALSLPQVLSGVSAQLVLSLQDLRKLEAVCLKVLPTGSVPEFQDFDRIMQVLGQLAQCCEGLSLESGLRDVQIGRSVVERLTLAEVRQRLLAADPQTCVGSGDVEFF
ncbi:hypothetical protein [Gluconobacter sp.]|uniref:hypothetical protein n=1 Tax=Gluconobacter sp. TaxID=1876758 RepID=UPI0039E98D69